MAQGQSGHSFIRPTIRNQPAMGVHKVDAEFHRLQWNENPFDFPADLKEEVLQRLARISWSRYPLGLRAYDVIEAVAKSTELDAGQVIVGNGSGDILRIVISAILQSGDHMVTLSPTFNSYGNHARQAGAEVHSVALDPKQNFELPVERILEEAKLHKAKLIVICAPNNPTGTIFPPEQLRKIVLESDALVLIDAAYAEFCGQDLRFLLAESDRVVMAHTLSKAYAMAGVRVGYALTSAEIAKELQKLVVNFTFSPFAEAAAIIAIENKARFKPLIEAVVSERERLQAELMLIDGVSVYPSGTNFVLVDIGRAAKDAQSYLRTEERVLVADMGMYAGYENFLRISIGRPEENDLVVHGIRHYLATVSS